MNNILLTTLLALLILAPTAQAGSTLFLGDPPSPSLGEGGTYLYGDEVVPIPNDFLQVMLNGQGQPTLDSPLYLILGIPNETSFSTPISDLSNGTATGPTYATNLDSGEEVYEEVYSALGIGAGSNNSNSFTNWSAAESSVNGIDADFFGLFVYQLYDTGITGGSTIDVYFSSDIPDGTFVVAYGTSDRKTYSTPFTESGLTRKVPEPGMLMLLGTGLLSLGIFGRKLLRKQAS